MWLLCDTDVQSVGIRDCCYLYADTDRIAFKNLNMDLSENIDKYIRKGRLVLIQLPRIPKLNK